MRCVGRPERLLGFAALVVLVDVLDLEHGNRATRGIGERHLVTPWCLVDGQADRERPWQTVREPHGLEHGLVVVASHEPFERRQRATREQLQIGELARRQRQPFEPLNAVRPLARPVDELAAVRSDQACLGVDDHAATAAGIRPRTSSSSTIRTALSCGSSCSDSMQISGFAGAS